MPQVAMLSVPVLSSPSDELSKSCLHPLCSPTPYGDPQVGHAQHTSPLPPSHSRLGTFPLSPSGPVIPCVNCASVNDPLGVGDGGTCAVCTDPAAAQPCASLSLNSSTARCSVGGCQSKLCPAASTACCLVLAALAACIQSSTAGLELLCVQVQWVSLGEQLAIVGWLSLACDTAQTSAVRLAAGTYCGSMH